MLSRRISGVFFDFGDTLIVEEPGKHLWEMEPTPIEGAVEVLQQLKSRFKLGIISNTVGSGDAELVAVIDQLGFSGLFNAVVTSRDFGHAKPDPEIFREAARRMGLALEETCMVGDRLETDIAGALGAGIPGIWLQHDHARLIPGIQPTHTVANLRELRDWLLTRQTYTQDRP